MPLLKWKPASDITVYRRQHAINELFIADERENNPINKKHRRTLVSTPPVYAGNGIWEDLKLLWGYYTVNNLPDELERPCTGVSFPATTFYVMYSDFYSFTVDFKIDPYVLDSTFNSAIDNKVI
jgi:hypothetical protein